MSKRRMGLIVILTLVVIGGGLAAIGPIMSRVEQPKYQVINAKGAIEVRSYGAMIAAEVTVSGPRKQAINDGFRLLAGYIFGANNVNTEISMTAPVRQQRSRTIAMTAPVTQQGENGKWRVQFIMPGRWTMDTLPTPNDERVKLTPLTKRLMVAIKFSGTANEALISKKTKQLKRYMSEQNLSAIGEPLYAFYNPPWTLPILRRNEIMFEITSNNTAKR